MQPMGRLLTWKHYRYSTCDPNHHEGETLSFRIHTADQADNDCHKDNPCQGSDALNFNEIVSCAPNHCSRSTPDLNAVLNPPEQGCRSGCQSSASACETHCVIAHPLEHCCAPAPTAEVHHG